MRGYRGMRAVAFVQPGATGAVESGSSGRHKGEPAMFASSRLSCRICGAVTPDIVVDHCHETQVVRDWLCRRCNAGLGFFQDDSSRLRAAAAYIDAHRANPRTEQVCVRGEVITRLARAAVWRKSRQRTKRSRVRAEQRKARRKLSALRLAAVFERFPADDALARDMVAWSRSASR